MEPNVAKPTVSFVSLGCAKNLVDSEKMLGLLAESGCAIIGDGGQADVDHDGRLDMVYTPLEVAAVMVAVALVVTLGRNGETNWFEGTLLLGLYLILAVVFFFLPGTTNHPPT